MPYVVRQGDTVFSIATKIGSDPSAVWNDPNNAALRKVRPDPAILLPGDILYVPA